MPGEVFVQDLNEAFKGFQSQFSLEFHQPLSPQDFSRGLKELDGNFTRSEQLDQQVIISFHNPSVRDFVQNYLVKTPDELIRLLRTATFFDQLIWLWDYRPERKEEYTFRFLIRTHATDFLIALNRVMDSPVCRLWNVQDPYGRVRKTKAGFSFENRLAFIVGVSSFMNDAKFTALTKKLIDTFKVRIADAKPEKEEVMDVLEILENHGLCSAADDASLSANLKAFLSSGFYRLDDFKPWLRFTELYPELITAAERHHIARQFTDFQASFHSDQDDPDYVREEALEAEELGKEFGVDVSAKVAELQAKAAGLEDEASGGPDDDERSGSGTAAHAWCSDSEIQSIFEQIR
jgi:hypothetical protein